MMFGVLLIVVFISVLLNLYILSRFSQDLYAVRAQVIILQKKINLLDRRTK